MDIPSSAISPTPINELFYDILESIDDGFLALDKQWTVIYLNKVARKVLQLGNKKVEGSYAWNTFAGFEGTPVYSALMKGAETNQAQRIEYFFDNQQAWFQVHVYPSERGVSVYFQNITERKNQEEMLQFLNQAGESLTGVIDYSAALKKISHLIVPRLADWFAIDILNENGQYEQLLVHHQDPERIAWAHQVREKQPISSDDYYGVAQVIRTGKSELYAIFTDDMIKNAARDAEHLKMLRQVGFHSMMVVPLSNGAKAFGAITFVTTKKTKRTYTAFDLSLAEEFSKRVSLTILNAKLYKASQDELEMRKLAQAALAQSENQIRLISNALPVGVGYVTLAGKITYINKTFTQWFSLERHILLGRMFKSVVGEENFLYMERRFEKAFKGESISFETHLALKQGMKVVDVRLVPDINELNQVRGLVVLFIDITEKIKTQHALRESEIRLELAEQAGRFATVDWHHGFNKLLFSGNITQLINQLPGVQCSPRQFAHLIHPDDFEIVKVALHRAFVSGELHTEFRVKADSNAYVWMMVKSKVYFDDIIPVRMVGIVMDISDRKQAEEKLTDSNHELLLLNELGKTISASLDIHHITHTLTNITTLIAGADLGMVYYKTMNETGSTSLHISRNDGYNSLLNQLGFPEGIDLLQPQLDTTTLLKFDDLSQYEASFQRQYVASCDKTLGLFRSYISVPICSSNYQVIGCILLASLKPNQFDNHTEHLINSIAMQSAIALDNALLYEAKNTEEERFRLLSESTPQIIWSANADGVPDYFNSRWFTYTGWINQSEQPDWTPFIHEDDLATYHLAWNEAKESGIFFECEFRLRWSFDGSYRWYLCRALPMEDKAGHVVKWFGSAMDIDDQRRLNEKKDEFISIASHELKTPLTSIKAYVQLLERELIQTNAPIANAYVQKTKSFIDKLNNLISDLLDVSKIQSGKLLFNMFELDFDTLVQDTIETIQHTSTHKLILQGDTGIRVQGDRQRLEQVFTNLLNNAIKYSPNADTVIIDLKKEKQFVIASIKDYGIGIPKSNQARIFDRFYRVEGVSYQFTGLGIGLYITHEIVCRHGGSIWVESEEGKGSTFFVKIPLNGAMA